MANQLQLRCRWIINQSPRRYEILMRTRQSLCRGRCPWKCNPIRVCFTLRNLIKCGFVGLLWLPGALTVRWRWHAYLVHEEAYKIIDYIQMQLKTEQYRSMSHLRYSTMDIVIVYGYWEISSSPPNVVWIYWKDSLRPNIDTYIPPAASSAEHICLVPTTPLTDILPIQPSPGS